jgi:hypothetical protein
MHSMDYGCLINWDIGGVGMPYELGYLRDDIIHG